MEGFSSFKREEIFTEMKKTELDILVVGGGITGAGISLDAVTRGLKVAVVEMQDFAAGTSSRSTKLVHGGLRYLKQFEVKMVAEVGKERAIVYENGPHVTTPEWMMLPFHKGGTFGPFSTNIGLRVYDYLAGVKKVERRKMFKPEEALRREPLIKSEGLRGAGYYVEYKTDDARLTIEVMKRAVEKGASAINYAKVVDFIYNENNKLIGTVVEDQITGDQHSIYAKKIINACGPWVDGLRKLDGSNRGKHLHLTKGVHLVFPNTVFPLQQAIYFDTPDGRMVFAIPRDQKTYVGTTDTTYEGDITHPTMTKEDRDYIIHAINYMFPSLGVTADDVESSWAGLRPLIAEEGKGPSEISRKDEIFISNSGLISMAGGKLTGYRKMAQEAVDTVVEQLKEELGILYSKSDTEKLPISGGDVGGSTGFTKYKKEKVKEGLALGISEESALTLVQRYGSNVETVFEIYQNRKQDAEIENIDPVVFAQLCYGIENELVYKPVDFFVRRTGALFFAIDWVKDYKTPVIDYMAKVLHWNEEQKQQYTEELDKLLCEAVTPVE
ncbi:FAD-dependent oxidoreductase [Ornithinibacillus sp. L9]|uniref:Aerobic glycerol-3-phosphate dehydrogenase n=1 Tax=Ornithinibacillus caprae TaxID=2678566 RepID=A0A6N8FI49_9BACI|nr:FAD-dependent oxidoreductase [Ornithinibacillus caprae]MUK89103.1 FAD-dependent oxidoreductase [Ornithinibacillus caprae]